MKKGDRVTMLKFDGWAFPGWGGIVIAVSPGRSNIHVKWDNGKTYSHMKKYVRLMGREDGPNIAFLIHKLNKEKKK